MCTPSQYKDRKEIFGLQNIVYDQSPTALSFVLHPSFCYWGPYLYGMIIIDLYMEKRNMESLVNVDIVIRCMYASHLYTKIERRF